MESVDIDAIQDLLEKVDSSFDHVCVLDSSQLQDHHSSFEALVLAGNEIVQGNFQTAVNRDGRWKFGYISYEYKNALEALSSSHNPHAFKDQFQFVEANLVVAVQAGELKVLHGELPSKQQKSDVEPLPRLQFKPRISSEEYLSRIRSLLSHIQLGNIYEVNFCQEFFVEKAEVSMSSLFASMRLKYPSPFISYLKMGRMEAVCNSPERFLKRSGNTLVSQPIKGTAPRINDPEHDALAKKELQNDPKERSENIMITDLVRNDLSKHAIPGSVHVEELCGVYTFPLWHQMISTIVAKVEETTSNAEVITGAFPMGSMTGAPKIRAMELIDEHESFGRGLYSGSIGYITPNGDFDFNVVIRTFLYNGDSKYLSYSTGGAITSKSIPEKEYDECLLKAKLINELFNGSN